MKHKNTEVLLELLDELTDWDFDVFPEFVVDHETAAELRYHLMKWDKNRKRQNKYYEDHSEIKNQQAKARYQKKKQEILTQRKVSSLKKVIGG